MALHLIHIYTTDFGQQQQKNPNKIPHTPPFCRHRGSRRQPGREPAEPPGPRSRSFSPIMMMIFLLPFHCRGCTALFFFHLQSRTPQVFTKGSIQNGHLEKFITSVNQQIVFISNKATSSLSFFHLHLAMLNSGKNGAIKCRMEMK